MSEEQRKALIELAELCKKYNFTITTIEGRVNFRFMKDGIGKNYYAFGFDRYTTKVQKWADVEIASDE